MAFHQKRNPPIQLSFLMIWISVISESNVIQDHLLYHCLSLFLCTYMVLNAFSVLLQAGLESSFQYMLRTPHRRCSDFFELFASSLSVMDQKHLCWLICRIHLNFSSLWNFLLFSSLCNFAALSHIFSSFSLPLAWDIFITHSLLFIQDVSVSEYFWAKYWRIISPISWLQTLSLLLQLQRVGSSVYAAITTKLSSGWHPTPATVNNFHLK